MEKRQGRRRATCTSSASSASASIRPSSSPPRRCDLPRGPARTRPSCGPRTAAAASPSRRRETQPRGTVDRPSSARMTRWSSSRTGRSRAWCGPIPTTSPIPSCWRWMPRRRARSIPPTPSGRGQVGDHAGPAQGILRPSVGQLFASRRSPSTTVPRAGNEYTVLLYVPGERPFDLYRSRAARPPEALCEARLHHRRCRASAALPALRARRRRLARTCRSTSRARCCRTIRRSRPSARRSPTRSSAN